MKTFLQVLILWVIIEVLCYFISPSNGFSTGTGMDYKMNWFLVISLIFNCFYLSIAFVWFIVHVFINNK